MNRSLSLLVSFLFLAALAVAQPVTDSVGKLQTDSLTLADSLRKAPLPVTGVTDSVSVMPLKNTGWKINPAIPLSLPELSWQILQQHPYFGFSANLSVSATGEVREFKGKDLLFYILVFLLMVYALLRLAFPKYFNDLFRLFFRTTLKQRQISEQLIQTPLPSLLLNALFVISAGLYITFILEHFKLNPLGNFWLLFLYCCMGLSVIYFIKFVGLKVSGWVFNMQEGADSYIFIVFVVNKMIGILILPFLIMLAFTTGNLYTVAMTLSWCLLTGLLGYRFILTFAAIRNQVRVNPFHFFLYLCAFEIAPLLLIYKGLLVFFTITT